jgi:hypothetical protein
MTVFTYELIDIPQPCERYLWPIPGIVDGENQICC